ncbi:Gp37-like protein, partial [Nocardia concava]|uniref:Gp37-like protein n=1 Tax=Nocardia concava TaxID=257281 RepID=UPI0005941978
MPAPVTTINFGLTLEEQCRAIWTATREQARKQERMRLADPTMLFFDGEMRLQHLVRNEYGTSVAIPSNDTGTIDVTVPFDSPVGQWLWEEQERIDRGEGSNFNVVIEYCGSRIG